MRKLASIKKISNISPIEGRDRIVLATVDGWSVIVKKDEFRVGDLCVYVEIDSVMPEKPEFEFLRKTGFRIKTMRMAGVVSQGICFPLNILPYRADGYELNEDVTSILSIKQYEGTMDVEPSGEKKPNKRKYPRFLMRMPWFRKLVSQKKLSDEFPSFINKTDEVRIQNSPGILRDKNTVWVATEKIDGQSGTFCLVRHKSRLPFVRDKFEYIVCSRNKRKPVKDNSTYWYVSEKYHIEECLRELIGDLDWIAIQGECIGPKVQGNKYKVSKPDLYVFNLITPSGRMESMLARHVCQGVDLKFVPILENVYVLPDTVDEVLKYAHGQSRIGDTLREGIVFRSSDGQKSFKAVDPLFLMKYDE